MADTPIGGQRLWSYRSGDRSEYMATYGLSRFSFVYPFPRQEDFGIVDLLCILSKREGKLVLPETAFYVQVKGNTKPFSFGRGALSWIANHMDHPLFACVADKSKDSLSIYALTPVIEALFLEPEAVKIKVSMRGERRTDPVAPIRNESGVRFEIETGPPILRKTLSELETDNGEAYSVKRPWEQDGADNSARRRVGRTATTRFLTWQTNVPVEHASRLGLYFFSHRYEGGREGVGAHLDRACAQLSPQPSGREAQRAGERSSPPETVPRRARPPVRRPRDGRRPADRRRQTGLNVDAGLTPTWSAFSNEGTGSKVSPPPAPCRGAAPGIASRGRGDPPPISTKAPSSLFDRPRRTEQDARNALAALRRSGNASGVRV